MGGKRGCHGAVRLAALLLLAGLAGAGGECRAETAAAAASAAAPPRAVTAGVGGRFLLFPGDDLYPAYIADPLRTGFGAQRMWYTRREIPESGGDRLFLKASGTFGILRIPSTELPAGGWQFSAIGGVDGMYDNENALDNIGWDGVYGLLATGRLAPGLAVKLGGHHTSSHVGDEYAERTGRRRLGYTREELLGGVSWDPIPGWRLYGEGGWGYGLGNRELMEPWRLQGGIEYTAEATLWRQRLGWYGAANVSTMEERNWRPDTTLQAGLLLRSYNRNWRLGVEYHYGRPAIGEFFQETESYLSAGLWLDL